MNRETTYLTIEQMNGYRADFRVRYRFFSIEGGRYAKQGQGYWSDFEYAQKWPKHNTPSVIWP